MEFTIIDITNPDGVHDRVCSSLRALYDLTDVQQDDEMVKLANLKPGEEYILFSYRFKIVRDA